MLCVLYVTAVGALLGIAGLLVERALPATMQRRWIWCLLIPASIALPGFYRSHHAMAVSEILPQGNMPSIAGTVSLSILDPAWWARTETMDSVINRFWLVASATIFIWGVANILWISIAVFLSRRQRGGSLVIDGIPVVITKSMGPATVELLRSRVLLPRWVLGLPGEERRYVIRHEEEHRRSHDGRLLLFASLALLLMPWNLSLWWMLRRLRLAVEMDCDNRVVKALGDPNAYGELLLKIAQATSPGPRIQPAFLGGVGMLERRIKGLVSHSPLKTAQKFLLPAFVAVLLLIVVKMPHPIVGSTAHSHVMTPSHK